MASGARPGTPKPTLTLFDAVAMIVGLIVGAGIFGTPSIVAGAVEGAIADACARRSVRPGRAVLRRSRDCVPSESASTTVCRRRSSSLAFCTGRRA